MADAHAGQMLFAQALIAGQMLFAQALIAGQMLFAQALIATAVFRFPGAPG